MSDSHSDVDDELLALAGGADGSSDDEASNAGSRERSQSLAAADNSPPRSVATKKTQAKKGRNSDVSEDEGEASDPGTPNSQESVPMDESDSDEESDAPQSKALEDDVNKYPIDGLFVSHAEKKEIMSMREVEREQILAEREQEKERLRQKVILRQLVTNNQQEEKQKKRKASAADLEDGQRKTSRQRTKAGATRDAALNGLKRARAEKDARMRRRENDRRRERSPSYRSVSSRGRHSDDSDVEWAATSKKKRSATPEVASPAELRDVERCRLSRTRFAKVWLYPGFKDAITGCYVRIHLGPDPHTREPVYRMAVIKGFSTGRPYAVQDERNKPIVTDTYVVAAHGKAEREWPFIACSESPFTDAEWSRYQKTCQNEGISLPKKPELLRKVDGINNLINREWKDEEVTEKIRRQRELQDRFSGVERQKLEKDIEQAKSRGDDQLANELQDRLDRIPQPRLAFQTAIQKKSPTKPSGPSQQERLAAKNRLNRQLNAKQVREAQLAERRKVRQIKDEDVEKERTSRAGSGASSPANGTPKLGAQKTAAKDRGLLPHIAKLREQQMAEAGAKKGVPTIHKGLTDDDIIGALDLDIDVEI